MSNLDAEVEAGSHMYDLATSAAFATDSQSAFAQGEKYGMDTKGNIIKKADGIQIFQKNNMPAPSPFDKGKASNGNSMSDFAESLRNEKIQSVWISPANTPDAQRLREALEDKGIQVMGMRTDLVKNRPLPAKGTGGPEINFSSEIDLWKKRRKVPSLFDLEDPRENKIESAEKKDPEAFQKKYRYDAKTQKLYARGDPEKGIPEREVCEFRNGTYTLRGTDAQSLDDAVSLARDCGMKAVEIRPEQNELSDRLRQKFAASGVAIKEKSVPERAADKAATLPQSQRQDMQRIPPEQMKEFVKVALNMAASYLMAAQQASRPLAQQASPLPSMNQAPRMVLAR